VYAVGCSEQSHTFTQSLRIQEIKSPRQREKSQPPGNQPRVDDLFRNHAAKDAKDKADFAVGIVFMPMAFRSE
jgi:hypothetical protein